MGPQVLKGAEPFYFAGDDRAILSLHGFTGTTQSIRYLAQSLNRLHGFTVSGPRLAGHGTCLNDMEKTGYLDWLESAEEALDELVRQRKRVIVAGLSMGGTLAMNLAARFRKEIIGVVAINAPAIALGEALSAAVAVRSAPTRLVGIGSDIKAVGVTELAYTEVPLECARQVILLCAITGALLARVDQPILVMQSRIDHVVPPANAHEIVTRVASSDIRLQWLENSYHVATLDHDRDRIVEQTASFVRSIT